MRVANGIPLGSPLRLTVVTINHFETVQAREILVALYLLYGARCTWVSRGDARGAATTDPSTAQWWI
jgi:hypothetical protein